MADVVLPDFGMPIAASAAEGSRVNAGDAESFGPDYLWERDCLISSVPHTPRFSV